MIGIVSVFQVHDIFETDPKLIEKIISFWRLNMKAFGVKKLIIVNIDNLPVTCGDLEIEFEVYNTLEEVLKKYSDYTFVFLECAQQIDGIDFIPLKNFNHPTDNVLYIFGSDYSVLNLSELKEKGYLEGNFVVSIGTGSTIPLWAHTAMSIVLYDRKVKLSDSNE